MYTPCHDLEKACFFSGLGLVDFIATAFMAGLINPHFVSSVRISESGVGQENLPNFFQCRLQRMFSEGGEQIF